MQRWIKQSWVGACSLLSAAVMAFGLMAMPVAQAKGPAPDSTVTSTIALADLPKQGRETYALILAGGPFPYEKDGTVFGNRERLLPAQKRGFYREYTVRTPYARNRGAKRIVCGGSQPVKPEVCYYTEDHYASFKRIAP
jgi:ribonuclease T1